MSEAYPAEAAADGSRHDDGARALAVADWVNLLAAPTFAIMALITGVLSAGSADSLCSSAHDGSPLTGMVPMYLLMCGFHVTPWLKLVSGRQGGLFRRRVSTAARNPAH